MDHSELFNRLAQSKFRSSFYLKEKDKVASVAKVRKASAEIDGEQVEISDGEEPESEASDNSEES